MQNNTKHYEEAIWRNLEELNNAILERRALKGLYNANAVDGLNFFRLAEYALYNDIILYIIRVFECSTTRRNVGSFWYIVKVNKAEAEAAAKECSVSLDEIAMFFKDFKNTRDKTHVHIDLGTLMNPHEAWMPIYITHDNVRYLLENTFNVLSFLYHKVTGVKIDLPDYDGSDVVEIIRSYKKCHP